MIWRIIKNDSLSDEDKLRIAEIKNQHWPYGISSQLEWMKKNIKDEDYHLIGEDRPYSSFLLSYSTLSRLFVNIDDTNYEAIGVGGVCVSKSILHCGMGKQLMEEVDCFIRKQGKPGILLCQDKVVEFYMKYNWMLVDFNSAKVAGMPYYYNIMTLDNTVSCNEIVVDRYF